jgi:hypothetical protein
MRSSEPEVDGMPYIVVLGIANLRHVRSVEHVGGAPEATAAEREVAT